MEKQDFILTGLKAEICETLFFFVQMDLANNGKISKGTVECFEMQKVKIPDLLKDLIEE